jgi:hypothetical protein
MKAVKILKDLSLGRCRSNTRYAGIRSAGPGMMAENGPCLGWLLVGATF